METIGTTKTARFENYLIIGLDGKWENIFGKLPEFDAKLDKKRRIASCKYKIYSKLHSKS